MSKKLHKKLDIVLVHPPPWSINRPPLGIATISSFLRRNGINAHLLDINIDLYHKVHAKSLFDLDMQESWIDLRDIRNEIPNLDVLIDAYVNEIINLQTRIIGFSVSNPKEYFTIELIQRLHARNNKIKFIIGGSVCATSDTRNIITSAVADDTNLIFVVGEGEFTIMELVKALNEGRNLNYIKGAILVDNRKEKSYAPRKLITNLDIIGFPDYREFDLSSFKEKCFEIEWSRGCIANCVFCSVRTLQGYYRCKSAKRRFEEIVFLNREYGVDTFSMCDSVLNGNIIELEKFCEFVIEANIKIKWSGQITPRKRMTKELFGKMQRAGCYRLEFGVESGSEKIIGRMKKIFTVETSSANIKDCQDAGIKTVIYLIIGFPGETAKDFNDTLQFLEKNKTNIDLVRSFRQLYLIPGAHIYSNLEEYGIIRPENDYFGNKWYNKEGNDYNLRMSRIARVNEKLSELGIKSELTDLKNDT